jgi:hypothetical protein
VEGRERDWMRRKRLTPMTGAIESEGKSDGLSETGSQGNASRHSSEMGSLARTQDAQSAKLRDPPSGIIPDPFWLGHGCRKV